MSIATINDRIRTKQEELNHLNHVVSKLEPVRKETIERLATTDNEQVKTDLNGLLRAVEHGHKLNGWWPSHLIDDPFNVEKPRVSNKIRRPNPDTSYKPERYQGFDNADNEDVKAPDTSWRDIKFIGLTEIRARITNLTEQIEALKSQLPTEDEIGAVKFKATTLAIECSKIQKSRIEMMESSATVLMGLVDLLIAEFLPVYKNDLVPLDLKINSSTAKELQLQQGISEIMQTYDLARSYKFKIPVKPVVVSSELTELLSLCRAIIPQLINGDTSNLAKYEAMTGNIKQLQESLEETQVA